MRHPVPCFVPPTARAAVRPIPCSCVEQGVRSSASSPSSIAVARGPNVAHQERKRVLGLVAKYPFSRWLRGPDLNRRPSGYEPDELPGCSTPRQKRGGIYDAIG